MTFDLDKFEKNCYSRDYEKALLSLGDLISSLDRNLGQFGSEHVLRSSSSLQSSDHQIKNVLVRICSAITTLFSDPNFNVTQSGLNYIFTYHRWLSLLFACNDFINMDHIIKSFNNNESNYSTKNGSIELNINKNNLAKLCLLYSQESEIPLDLDIIWNENPKLILSLGLVLLTPRFMGSYKAFEKREILLPWVAKKLTEINDVEDLPLSNLHDIYMHCSYAIREDKHDIKKSINRVVRMLLVQNNIFDINPTKLRAVLNNNSANKPTLLVILEWFSKGHSIYRTHSKTIEALRNNFYVIGLGFKDAVDEVGKGIFDEFFELPGQENLFQNLKEIRDLCDKKNVSIVYMPSVGMFLLTIFVTNLRLAPIQIIALGHPATTHSDNVDYVVVEEDYVGSSNCFSEKLILLPKDGMPYRPSAFSENLNLTHSIDLSINKSLVNVCVASTTMKINPVFLETCAKIIKRSKNKIHFHFLVGQSLGLTSLSLERVLKYFLGDDVTLHNHQPYDKYMSTIHQMDMFMNPFPFGNTNGIIDTVSAGLVGICKTGPEVHEHIDEGLFRRLNFPSWMIADSIEKYINSAVRLIDNEKERNSLRERLAGPDKILKIFSGRPEIMGNIFKEKLSLLMKNE